MANFYADNDDLRFYVERGIDWEPVVGATALGAGEDGALPVSEALQVYADILDLVGRFAAEQIAPHAAAIDRGAIELVDGEVVVPPALDGIFAQIAELELHRLCLPVDLGGMNAPLVLYLFSAELFARALLAWPETPAAFRLGLVEVLFEELAHMALYERELERLGFPVGSFPVRDWFWQRVPTATEPAGFLALVGLGLEAANLDHGEVWAERLEAAGDPAAASWLHVPPRRPWPCTMSWPCWRTKRRRVRTVIDRRRRRPGSSRSTSLTPNSSPARRSGKSRSTPEGT